MGDFAKYCCLHNLNFLSLYLKRVEIMPFFPPNKAGTPKKMLN